MAEEVLEIDNTNVKAIFAKAEALYYNCEFEQALVTYHRGSVSKKSKRYVNKEKTKNHFFNLEGNKVFVKRLFHKPIYCYYPWIS